MARRTIPIYNQLAYTPAFDTIVLSLQTKYIMEEASVKKLTESVEVAELWCDIVPNSAMRNGTTANPMDVYGRMRQP